MALTWPSKVAAEALEFTIDWTQRLAGDTIATSVIAIAAGAVTIAAQSNTTTSSSAFLEGGTPGETAVVTCEITTASGQTMDETVILPVAAQELAYAALTQAVYQTAEDIDRYIVGNFGPVADAWLAASSQDKVRAAVASTRMLNRQAWEGAPTDSAQSLAFPRTGLFYPDGSAVDSATVPQRVNDAACEIAALLVSGSPVQNDPNVQTTRTLKAGSVMIEYFRNIEPLTPFPQNVTELIALWLGGGVSFAATASGTHDKTSFDQEYRFVRGF